ncbi:MAG: hypothetical protein KTR31_19905 [Myxococcales bacterium]|nr:hypothetical protein [Myxococcales bacterium]
MTRLPILAVALVACDPEEGTGADPDGPVVYETAPCGSVDVVDTEPSTDVDAPATFAVGEIVEGRLDPEATTNFRHFWDVDLGRGTYHLVLDESTPDGGTTNMGLAIERLDAAGVEIETLIRGNEIDHRIRLHTVVVIDSPTTLRMEISNVFRMEDYQLGIFTNGVGVPSPFFEDCAPTTPIELGVPLDMSLPAAVAEDDDEIWLTFDAAPGDYGLTVDATQASGSSTNIQYGIAALDRFGQRDRYVDVLRANEIDVTTRLVGGFNVGEPASYWVRVVNDFQALELTLTLEEE